MLNTKTLKEKSKSGEGRGGFRRRGLSKLKMKLTVPLFVGRWLNSDVDFGFEDYRGCKRGRNDFIAMYFFSCELWLQICHSIDFPLFSKGSTRQTPAFAKILNRRYLRRPTVKKKYVNRFGILQQRNS